MRDDGEGSTEAEVSPYLKREYWCFISYRHADNKEPGRQWATWLHQFIETYEVPSELVGTQNERGDVIPDRIFPVFRDEEELPADAELSKPIEAALRRSRFLVVLCSPQSMQSRWVADEILRFKQLGKADNILAAIIEGRPDAPVDPARPGSSSECFPLPLRFELNENGQPGDKPTEPIAADFRLADGSKGWASPGAYRDAMKSAGLSNGVIAANLAAFEKNQNLMLLKIVAGILGVPLGVLTRRDKRYRLEKKERQNRVLRRWLAALGALVVAALVSLFVAIAKEREAQAERKNVLVQKQVAENQTQVAEAQKRVAETQTQLAQRNESETRRSLSMSDYIQANTLVTANKRSEALAYLARSIRSNPDNLAAGQRALLLLQQGLWYLPQPWPETGGFEVKATTFSAKNEMLFVGVDGRGGSIRFGVFRGDGRPLYPPVRIPGATDTFLSVKMVAEGRIIEIGVDQKNYHYLTETGKLAVAPLSEADEARRMEQFASGVQAFRDSTEGEKISKIILSPSRRFLAATVDGPDLVLCDTRTSAIIRKRISEVEIRSLSFSPDEKSIIIGHDDASEFTDGLGSAEIIPFELARDGLDSPHWLATSIPNRTYSTSWLPGGIHFVRNSAEICDIRGRTLSSLVSDSDKDTYSDDCLSADGRRLVAGAIFRRIGCPPFPMAKEDEPMVPIVAKYFASDPGEEADPGQRTKNGALLVRNEASGKYIELAGSRENERLDGVSMDPPLAFTGQGVVSEKQELWVWDLSTGRRITSYPRPPFYEFIGLSRERAFALGGEGLEGVVLVWNFRTGEELPPIRTGLNKTYLSLHAKIHPDRDRLFVNYGGDLKVWDLNNFGLIGKADLDSSHNAAVRYDFSPGGTYLRSALTHAESEDHVERLWDARNLLPLGDRIGDVLGGDGHRRELTTDSATDGWKVYFRADTSQDANYSNDNFEFLYLQLGLPETGPVPLWLADLIEAVGGHHLSKEAISEVADAKRREVIESVRATVSGAASAGGWAEIIRWWLDDAPDRKIAPGSRLKVTEVVNARLGKNSIPILTATGNAVPEDPRIFERLSALQGKAAKPDELSADFNLRRARRIRGVSEISVANPAPAPLPEERPAPVKPAPLTAELRAQAEEWFNRGERFRKGEGVARNPAEALAAYRHAADLGHAAAQHRMGVIYATGDGEPKNDEQAVLWYRRSADQGFAEAQYNLGVRYILGRGVQKSEAAGLYWYGKAADQGYEEARQQLERRRNK